MNASGILLKVNEVLEKIPIVVIVIVFLGYIGYTFYSFEFDGSSPLSVKKGRVTKLRDDIKSIQKKILEAQKFLEQLNAKKAELRELTRELDSAKATISEDLQIPALMKSTVLEAKKVGLAVSGINPREGKEQEYYFQQDLELSVIGHYDQLLVFCQNLTTLNQLVRVEGFKIKPVGAGFEHSISLSANLSLRTYRYNRSKADHIDLKDSEDLVIGAGAGGVSLKPTEGGSDKSSGKTTPPKVAVPVGAR